MQKYKEEAEARRKALLEAKAEAQNSAAAQYRCGPLGCEIENNFWRWCQHNELKCKIFVSAGQVGKAMEPIWEVGKEILGLAELENCALKRDLWACATLTKDLILTSKMRALGLSYRALTEALTDCVTCFVAGTKVLMADGSKQNIEDVQSGDKVLATDPYTGETGPARVQNLITTNGDKYVNTITIEARAGLRRSRLRTSIRSGVPQRGAGARPIISHPE